jgi:hypothetical protein
VATCQVGQVVISFCFAQQALHGKSARASFKARSSTGRSSMPTVNLPRFFILTRAACGRTASMRRSTKIPSPEGSTLKVSPGLQGNTTRFLESALTVMIGLSHQKPHPSSLVMRRGHHPLAQSRACSGGRKP